jgi:hypothetical protein
MGLQELAGRIPGSCPNPTPRRLSPQSWGARSIPLSARKLLRHRANIDGIDRSPPLSVPQVAAELQASEAYVRRLLISRRLYGVKVGPVWAIYPEDLEAFRRLRRSPGRPKSAEARPPEELDTRSRINRERASAGTDRALRKAARNRRRPGARG